MEKRKRAKQDDLVKRAREVLAESRQILEHHLNEVERIERWLRNNEDMWRMRPFSYDSSR